MENCRHNTSAEGSHTYANKRLPANIHHASPLEVARAVRCPEVILLGLDSTQSDTRLQGPVRVQVVRLDYCCNRCDYARRAFIVEQQRLRLFIHSFIYYYTAFDFSKAFDTVSQSVTLR